MLNSVWTVSSWSVFMQQQRTSNDVEGWHHRLNTCCSQQINVRGVNMYLLMKVLAKEAATVRMRAAMLKQGHRLRLQRNNSIQLNTKLLNLWETCHYKTISSHVLLQKCATPINVSMLLNSNHVRMTTGCANWNNSFHFLSSYLIVYP